MVLARNWIPSPPLIREPDALVFGMTSRTVSNRIAAAERAAGLGGGYSGHSPRVGMAVDLTAAGISLQALQVAGRWKSVRMPARYSLTYNADPRPRGTDRCGRARRAQPRHRSQLPPVYGTASRHGPTRRGWTPCLPRHPPDMEGPSVKLWLALA